MYNKSKKLHVGNLSFNVSEEKLQRVFEQAGPVSSVAIPLDRATGRQRGFAFVEMSSAYAAADAITILNRTVLDGRLINVNSSESPDRSKYRW
ncbi:MAG: RNA-binding protein [Candidatus Melainabacteria bacterium]|nr:RNA-binding protein [Candidatus Melainabacteria bacterium]